MSLWNRMAGAVVAMLASVGTCAAVVPSGSAFASGPAEVSVYSAPLIQGTFATRESSLLFENFGGATLLDQLNLQNGVDGDTTVYSQPIEVAQDSTVDTVTWWGTQSGITQGFVVSLQAGLSTVSSPAQYLPDGPVVYGSLAQFVLAPMASVTVTPGPFGQSQFQLTIPSTVLAANQPYRLTVAAFGGTFEWGHSSDPGCCGTGPIWWMRTRGPDYVTIPDSVAFALSGPAPMAPAITIQPSGTTVVGGQGFSLTAAASGTPIPTVQWQTSVDAGLTWADVPGATSVTYTGTTTAAMDGTTVEYRATFTNTAGSTTSDPASIVIAPSASTTSVSLTPSVTTPVGGQKVTLTAHVTSTSPGSPKVSSGTVTFADSGTPVATAPVRSGTARAVVTLAAGAHRLTAGFGGSGVIQPGQSGPLALQVTPATTAVLAGGATSRRAGATGSIAVSVRVTAPGGPVLAGTVGVSDGGSPLGSVVLNTKGKGSFATAALARGVHTLVFAFSGDASHAASTTTFVVTIT